MLHGEDEAQGRFSLFEATSCANIFILTVRAGQAYPKRLHQLIYYSKVESVGTVKTRLMPTSVIQSPRYYRHFFWPPGKNHHTFSCKKNPRQYVRQFFFGPLVTILMGSHCSCRFQLHLCTPAYVTSSEFTLEDMKFLPAQFP